MAGHLLCQDRMTAWKHLVLTSDLFHGVTCPCYLRSIHLTWWIRPRGTWQLTWIICHPSSYGILVGLVTSSSKFCCSVQWMKLQIIIERRSLIQIRAESSATGADAKIFGYTFEWCAIVLSDCVRPSLICGVCRSLYLIRLHTLLSDSGCQPADADAPL